MEIRLRCSRVIIVGGGSGIGLAIAKKLLENNNRVCIAGRNIEKLKKVSDEIRSEKLSYMEFDIGDINSHVKKLNDAACLLGGYFDGIVNAAGVHSKKNNWYISEEEYDHIMNIDLKAAIFLMRKATVLMQNNNIQGNILQIASIAGYRGVYQNSPYYMAKNTLINATRYMAKEVARYGIIINGVAPGITRTPMSPGKTLNASQQAIGRPIEAAEIADIALFMMSEQAKICIGDTILADGGFWESW